ncbi:MAG: adenylosuccinate synthase [Phycisphaeraceae bacterium]|nr:adenylosuccinate synthase [Phycisphaeraceae bacterium]
MTEPDVFDRLGLTQGHCAVVGMQYGDEGKGQIVDRLAERFDYVVRYNGGANAGHTVVIGDQKFALHLVPSGILCPNAINVVGNGVVVDPEQILKEMDGLRERGVKVGDNLRISDRAHVVMPYHKTQDALFDHALSKASGTASIGTTGRGIGPCYADKATRTTAIRIGDLLCPDSLKERVRKIVGIKNIMLQALAQSCGDPYTPLNADQIHADLEKHAQRLRPHICDTTQLLYQAGQQGKKLLFEGANATLLDIDHGTYPFVTSSSCASLGVYPGAGVPGGTLKNVVGIVKLYTSRVGAGPFPTELLDETASQIRERGREYGTTTGRPRRCGWLDLVAVRYAVRLSGVTAVVGTGLSVLRGLPSLKLCVGYRVDGRIIDTVPASCDLLARVEPVFEELPGFDVAVDECRDANDLPAEAKKYIQRVEQFIGVPLAMVCVGRRRDQILPRYH